MSSCLTDEKRIAVVVVINDDYNIIYIFFNHDVLKRQMQRIMRNLLLYDLIVSSQH